MLPIKHRLAALLCATVAAAACDPSPPAETATADAAISGCGALTQEGFDELSLGMFIHFSINTFMGGRRYPHNAMLDPHPSPALYRASSLDTDQWAAVAQRMGAEYAVFTAQHHMGFSMWDSKVTHDGREYDFDVASTEDPTDVVDRFLTSFRAVGIHAGLYYNIGKNLHVRGPVLDIDVATGRRPDRSQDYEAYEALVIAQLEELLTNYGHIPLLYLDAPGWYPKESFERLHPAIKMISEDTIVIMNIPPQFRSSGGAPIFWPLDAMSFEHARSLGIRGEELATGLTVRGQRHRVIKEIALPVYPRQWFWAEPGGPFTDRTEPNRPLHTAELTSELERARALGANLTINVSPDMSGRITDDVAAILEGVGANRVVNPTAEIVVAGTATQLAPGQSETFDGTANVPGWRFHTRSDASNAGATSRAGVENPTATALPGQGGNRFFVTSDDANWSTQPLITTAAGAVVAGESVEVHLEIGSASTSRNASYRAMLYAFDGSRYTLLDRVTSRHGGPELDAGESIGVSMSLDASALAPYVGQQLVLRFGNYPARRGRLTTTYFDNVVVTGT